MNRSRAATALPAFVAAALLILAALAVNFARLGSAIAREVDRAQAAYIQTMGSGEPVEDNARLLGHCLRREMLKSARAGIAHPDSWALTARLRALPFCTRLLPPVEPAQPPPIINAPRVRPIVASVASDLARAPVRREPALHDA